MNNKITDKTTRRC